MQKHLSPQSKTKYLELRKVVSFIDLMSFWTSCPAPVLMTQHGFSGIHPGQLSTGFTGLSLTDLMGCGKVIGQGDRDVSLLRRRRSYERKLSAPPGNRDTTKTSGMGGCCLTPLRRNTPFHSVFGSVRGCSTSLDLVSRGHAGRLAKPILFFVTTIKN